MNYIKHLTGFFEKVTADRTLNPTHISLYIALFQFWNCNRFRNPISINRDEIMRISKISSKATYHKCLKNLHSLGYIKYEPSYNPFKGSHVFLFNFADDLKPLTKSEKCSVPKNEPTTSIATEQVPNKSSTASETTNEQALVSYINNTNIPNNENNLNVVNGHKQAKINDEDVIARNEAISYFKNENYIKEKSSAKKEKKEMPEQIPLENSKSYAPAFADSNAEQTDSSRQKRSDKKEKENSPDLESVKSYFLQLAFPELEAIKFYNYFSSNGWLVGGKTPMVNWNAAAQNWMLNAPNFQNTPFSSNKNHALQLNTDCDKNYAEPL